MSCVCVMTSVQTITALENICAQKHATQGSTGLMMRRGLLHLVQVALVGAPNVGKSSLVQVLSTGLPEVCDYPFTTRTVKMGHFFVDGVPHQVNLQP